MSEEQQQPPADIEQYEEVYADVPQWPKVVGIFSIVWGSLGVVCNGCGTVWFLVLPQFLKMAEEQNGPAPDAFIPPPLMMIANVLSILVTALLLVAGILTVKRSMTGRVLHLVYAPLSILVSVVGLVGGMQQSKAVRDWVAQNPGSPYAKSAGTGTAGEIAGYAIAAFVMLYPLFTLVWFGLVKKTRESMTGFPDGALPPENAA